MGKLKLREIPTAFTLAAAKEADPEQKALLLREAAKAELLLKQLPAAGQAGSIDTPAVANLPAKTQTSLFNSPDVVPKSPSTLTPQDNEALNWATANPNDPRAAKILQKLGK